VALEIRPEATASDESSARERGRRLVGLAVPFYLGLALLAVGWRGCVRDASVFAAHPAASSAQTLPMWPSVALGLALGLAIVGLSQLWTRIWPSGEAVARMLGETLGELRLHECALLALASGFAEEMFFRGALQPELGLIAASIVFGLAHLVPRWPLVLWSLFAIAIGLVFGSVFDWTGSLWAPAVAHVVVNGVNLPMLSRRYGRGSVGA
jgi:hypothetical protein